MFFLLLSININGQIIDEKTSSLLDSLNKYKFLSPQKALSFGFQALELNNPSDVSQDLMQINGGIGEVLFFLNNDSKSLDYFSSTMRIHSLLPKNERLHYYVNDPPWSLINLGNIYYNNNRYETAKKYYFQAMDNFNLFESKFLDEKNNGIATSLTNLGLCYASLGNFNQAEYYLKKALELRNKYFNKSSIMFQYMTLINFYYKNNENELGDYYYGLANKLFIDSKSEDNQADFKETKVWYSHVLTIYGSQLKKLNKIKESLAILYDSKQITTTLTFNTDIIPDVNLEIAKCYIELKMYDNALKIILESLDFNVEKIRLEKLNTLAKIYSLQNNKVEEIKIKDSLIKAYKDLDYKNFEKIENKLVLYEKEKELYNNKIEKSRLTLWTYIAIPSFIILFVFLFYRSKYFKEKNIRLKLEKNEVSNELESKNRELASKANFILQRNEYLKNIIVKLNKSEVNEQSFRRVKKEVTELINSEKSYEEFDKIFTKVYPKFYKMLIEKYNLSQTYLRLAAYIKMNQSNNEIAKISGLSLRTIETQRYRLSKILNINKKQSLNSYINTINY